MGLLFNRSRVPFLSQMMLEEVSHFGELLRVLSTRNGLIDLIPTCRTLEADIVCELPRSLKLYSALASDASMLARFAFGNAIGAVDSLLSAGKELQIIRENDLQSSKMPLYTNFPSLVKTVQFLLSTFSNLTGRYRSSLESQIKFEEVSPSFFF
jgi:hypothetical protein